MTIRDTNNKVVGTVGFGTDTAGNIDFGVYFKDSNSTSKKEMRFDLLHGLSWTTGTASNYKGFELDASQGLRFFGTGNGWKTYGPK